jgi:hypothetical protein
MQIPHVLSGERIQHYSPDWTYLEELLGAELIEWFMWMCEVELADGTSVHAYKHVWTRRYFHLGPDGRAFVYVPRRCYMEIDPVDAIDLVFDEAWENRSGPLVPGDPESEREAVRAARERARGWP